MTPEQFLWLSLIAKVGLNAAATVLAGMKNAKTIDDAIAAVDAAQKVTIADFKREIQS